MDLLACDERAIVHYELSTCLPIFFMSIQSVANFQLTTKILAFNQVMNCAFRRISAIVAVVFPSQ